MENQKRIIIPKDLRNLFNNETGFNSEELFKVLDSSEETKQFLTELKPIIISYLKKEFPALSMLGIL